MVEGVHPDRGTPQRVLEVEVPAGEVAPRPGPEDVDRVRLAGALQHQLAVPGPGAVPGGLPRVPPAREAAGLREAELRPRGKVEHEQVGRVLDADRRAAEPDLAPQDLAPHHGVTGREPATVARPTIVSLRPARVVHVRSLASAGRHTSDPGPARPAKIGRTSDGMRPRGGDTPATAPAPGRCRESTAVAAVPAHAPGTSGSADGRHHLVADVEVGVDVLHVVAVLERVDQLEDLAGAVLVERRPARSGRTTASADS